MEAPRMISFPSIVLQIKNVRNNFIWTKYTTNASIIQWKIYIIAPYFSILKFIIIFHELLLNT